MKVYKVIVFYMQDFLYILYHKYCSMCCILYSIVYSIFYRLDFFYCETYHAIKREDVFCSCIQNFLWKRYDLCDIWLRELTLLLLEYVPRGYCLEFCICQISLTITLYIVSPMCLLDEVVYSELWRDRLPIFFMNVRSMVDIFQEMAISVMHGSAQDLH